MSALVTLGYKFSSGVRPIESIYKGVETRNMDRSPHLPVVDDDREIRDLLSRFLKKQGYILARRFGVRL